MKKILLTVAVILCAFLTAAPGIGPGAGGPIGPSPGGGGFVGGTITTPIKGATTADCSTATYSWSTADYGNTGITDITGSENVTACVNGANVFQATATAVTMSQDLICTSTNAATSGGITDTAITGADVSSAVVTANNAAYTGVIGSVAKTGADTTVGTVTSIGVKGTASHTGQTDAGAQNTYGGYFSGTGTTNGTTTAYGVYGTASGADTNYAGYFAGNVATTGVVLAPDAAASAPAYSFTTDPNSGVYSAGADTVGISAGGLVQLTCDATNTTSYNNLLFSTDNTLDIGASGATRPRTGYFGTDVNVGGDVNITDDLTCNQATVTVPSIGAASTTYDQSRNGLILDNTTASVVGPGVTTQVSPAAEFLSHAWDADGLVDDTHSWKMLNVPTTGNTTSSVMSFQHAIKNGAGAWGTYATRAEVSDAGITVYSNAAAATVALKNTTNPATGFDFQFDTNDALLWLRPNGKIYFATNNATKATINASVFDVLVPITVTGAVSASTTITVGSAASFGGGSVIAVPTKLTTDATVFHIWTAAALAAESCVNVRASCSVIDKAATASRNSYDKETLCCNAAGTTACDAVTAIREVEVEAAWDMTILPCDAIAGSCLVADAPVVAITGEAAHNLNWKCSVTSYVLTNG